MNVNLFFVNIIMCNSFVLYNQDDHQIVCKINIFIVYTVLTIFFSCEEAALEVQMSLCLSVHYLSVCPHQN